VRREILSTHAAFAAFGVFWGAWAALLPAVQRQTGASKGQLGLALLCVALGALAAMLATGAVLDRVGLGLVAPGLVLFGAAIVAPGFATSVGILAAALLAVGATSGGLDVVVNAQASALERTSGRRLMAVAHALYSAGVVVGSVSVGLARQAGAGPRGVVLAVAVVLVAAAALNLPAPRLPVSTAPKRRRLNLARPFVALGLLCAIAFVVENGGEQWSALFLETRLHGDPSVGGLGPASFAASMVVGRLAGGGVERRLGERVVLVSGAGLARFAHGRGGAVVRRRARRVRADRDRDLGRGADAVRRSRSARGGRRPRERDGGRHDRLVPRLRRRPAARRWRLRRTRTPRRDAAPRRRRRPVRDRRG
jgi:MFS family permease